MQSSLWDCLSLATMMCLCPQGKKTNDLTVTSNETMQAFDIAAHLLILGNRKWVSARKQIRFMGFVPNCFLAYLVHSDVKGEISLEKNKTGSGPKQAEICCLNCTRLPFSSSLGPFGSTLEGVFPVLLLTAEGLFVYLSILFLYIIIIIN